MYLELLGGGPVRKHHVESESNVKVQKKDDDKTQNDRFYNPEIIILLSLLKSFITRRSQMGAMLCIARNQVKAKSGSIVVMVTVEIIITLDYLFVSLWRLSLWRLLLPWIIFVVIIIVEIIIVEIIIVVIIILVIINLVIIIIIPAVLTYQCRDS